MNTQIIFSHSKLYSLRSAQDLCSNTSSHQSNAYRCCVYLFTAFSGWFCSLQLTRREPHGSVQHKPSVAVLTLCGQFEMEMALYIVLCALSGGAYTMCASQGYAWVKVCVRLCVYTCVHAHVCVYESGQRAENRGCVCGGSGVLPGQTGACVLGCPAPRRVFLPDSRSVCSFPVLGAK